MSSPSHCDHIIPHEFRLSNGHKGPSPFDRHSWFGSFIPNARWTLAYVKRKPLGGDTTKTPSFHNQGLILHLNFECCQMCNPWPVMIHEMHVGKQVWCKLCGLAQGAIYGSVGRPAVPPGNKYGSWNRSLPCLVQLAPEFENDG